MTVWLYIKRRTRMSHAAIRIFAINEFSIRRTENERHTLLLLISRIVSLRQGITLKVSGSTRELGMFMGYISSTARLPLDLIIKRPSRKKFSL